MAGISITSGSIKHAAVAIQAALLAGASVLTPAAAAADSMFPLSPACDYWRFEGDAFQVELHGATVKFPASGTTVGAGQVRETYQGPPETSGGLDAGGIGYNYGDATGGVAGRKIDITVNWTGGGQRDGTTTTFAGQVGDDGYATGTETTPWGSQGWRSSDTLSCDMSLEVAGTRAIPDSVVPDGPLKPGAPGKPPAAPSEIRVSWAPYNRGVFDSGITATVSITNNKNKPTVGCVYEYELGTRSFTVTGSQESTIDFPGVPTGKYWPVSVTCDNGLRYEGGTTY